MSAFIARNRAALSLMRSTPDTRSEVHSSRDSITVELSCNCFGCKHILRKPLVKAFFVSFVVSGLIAAILILFCAIQYNVPGDTLIEYLEKNPNDPKPNRTNDEELFPSSPPIFKETKEPAVCPCFQSKTLVDIKQNPKYKIDLDKSCKTNSFHKTLHYNEITSGGFNKNELEFAYGVDIRGKKDICIMITSNGADTKEISEHEGKACISLLNEELKEPCEKKRAQNNIQRQIKDSPQEVCSCFSIEDLTRPSNKYHFDEKNSCQTDNPLVRELFYSRRSLGSLRKAASYGFSVIINDRKAMCIGKDGGLMSISQKMGRSCFRLINDACIHWKG